MSTPGKFDQAAFRETLERLTKGTDFGGSGNLTPMFDPRLRDDFVEAAIEGRKIEDYRIALEACGFRFIPVQKLPPYKNGQARTEGEWRSAKLHMAFTDRDILAGFKKPEEFVTWIEKRQMAKRMKATGLLLGQGRRR